VCFSDQLTDDQHACHAVARFLISRFHASLSLTVSALASPKSLCSCLANHHLVLILQTAILFLPTIRSYPCPDRRSCIASPLPLPPPCRYRQHQCHRHRLAAIDNAMPMTTPIHTHTHTHSLSLSLSSPVLLCTFWECGLRSQQLTTSNSLLARSSQPGSLHIWLPQ
jgi:hypothetical protein